MRKLLPAIVWLILIYIVTAMAENLPPPNDSFWARVLDEGRHVAAHSFVWGVEIALIMYAAGIPRAARDARLLLALILAFGIGQETMQIIQRDRIQWVGTPWDLTVDVTAAVLVLRWFQQRYPQQTAPHHPSLSHEQELSAHG
jgi:hypothetical protein